MPKTTPIKVRACKRPATPFYVVTPEAIRLRYPERFERKKSFFVTRRAAADFCTQLQEAQRRIDSAIVALTEAQQFEASEAFALLAPRGRSLREAVAFFLEHLSTTEKSILFSDLADQVVASKTGDGLSAIYITNLRSRLGKFSKTNLGVIASAVTTTFLDDWLRRNVKEPQTRNNFRSDLRTAFSWALARGYVKSNPAAGVAKAKLVDEEVEALTVDEIRRLLHASDGLVLPEVAINVFAGIRPGEIERLDWREVDFEHREIDVKAAKSKTGQRRLVKMSDNLVAWLATCTGKGGPIVPHDTRTRYENTRARAGLARWPHDCLRHSYASYHLAHHKDAAALALQMGHTGTDLIFKHYRKVVTERDALAFWSLYPEGPLPT